MVVAVGLTVTLGPCTPPSLSIKSYESFVVLHDSVTDDPADTVDAEDVKLLMVGAPPVGAVLASQPG